MNQEVRDNGIVAFDWIIDGIKDIPSFFVRPFNILAEANKNSVRCDLIAALNVAIVLIPQSIAYALVAGLPPIMGLYSATVASANPNTF